MQSYQAYKESGFTWLGKVPEHWVFNKAKYIFNKMERPIREDDGVITAFRNGVVTLRTNRRTEGFTLSIKEIGYQGIRKGDLVIHEMDGFAGAIGVSDSDGKSTPVYTVCTPRKDASTKYYAYLLRMMAHNGFIQSLAKGIRERSTSFSFNIFQDLELPYFPLPEQQAITEFLDCKTAQIDRLIEKKQRQIDLLQEQRIALIDYAITKGLDPDAPMKDSGVEWLGVIPNHWEVMKVKRHIDVIDGDRGKEYPNENDFVNFGIPFLSSKNIIDNKLDLSDVRYISQEKLDRLGRGKLTKGDLVITVRGTIGSVGYFINEEYETAFINAQMMILRTGEELSSKYFYYFARSNYWFTQLDYSAYGAAQQQLSNVVLQNLSIVVPPRYEQESIEIYLDQKMAQIENAVRKVRNEISLLEEYRTALISEAVTGKIDVRENKFK